MNDIYSKIKELEIEKILWLLFIFISALNIYSDNIQELFLLQKNQKLEKSSKKIFTFTVTISLLIYLYFGYRNYNNFKNATEDKTLSGLRLAGSILIIVGTLLILYYDIKDQEPIGTPTI